MNTAIVKKAMCQAITVAQEEISQRSLGILEGIVIACEVEVGKPIETLKDIWCKAMDAKTVMLYRCLAQAQEMEDEQDQGLTEVPAGEVGSSQLECSDGSHCECLHCDCESSGTDCDDHPPCALPNDSLRDEQASVVVPADESV
jgi:hypothetical protein